MQPEVPLVLVILYANLHRKCNNASHSSMDAFGNDLHFVILVVSRRIPDALLTFDAWTPLHRHSPDVFENSAHAPALAVIVKFNVRRTRDGFLFILKL